MHEEFSMPIQHVLTSRTTQHKQWIALYYHITCLDFTWKTLLTRIGKNDYANDQNN